MAITPYRFSSTAAPYTPVSMRSYPVEYFSGTDTSIFFDEQLIDEVTSLEFSLMEKCLPIFTYASYTARAFIPGTRLVTGSFTTNLRSGNYLHELLYSQIQSDINPGALQLPATTTTPAPDPSTDPDSFAAWANTQKNLFWNSIDASLAANEVPDLSTQAYFVNNGFSILIVYGDVDLSDQTRNAGRIRTIDNVQIWSVGQRIGLDPGNIQEVWQFMAADINGDDRSLPASA